MLTCDGEGDYPRQADVAECVPADRVGGLRQTHRHHWTNLKQGG